jgi:hypothetical protein
MLTSEIRADLADKIHASIAEVGQKIDRCMSLVVVLGIVIEGLVVGTVSSPQSVRTLGLELALDPAKLNALLAFLLASAGIAMLAAVEQRVRKRLEFARQCYILAGSPDGEIKKELIRLVGVAQHQDWMVTLAPPSLHPEPGSSDVLPMRARVLYGLLTVLWLVPFAIPLHVSWVLLAAPGPKLWGLVPLVGAVAYLAVLRLWYRAMADRSKKQAAGE